MRMGFHDKRFDEGTRLKLDIFRRYIRAWVSVFMTNSPALSTVTSVNIYDLFSGPGKDASGNPGTPVIIVEEVKGYCQTRAALKSDKPVRMYFNDIEKKSIAALQRNLEAISCPEGCCHIEYSAEPFAKILKQLFPKMQDAGSANLVIMDQFGISDVTPEIVQQLARCSRTDILFFIPSSHVYRFREHPAFASKFDMSEQDLEYKTIHRVIVDYYRERLANMGYYLAPFSIKSGSSIHGVLFGSGSLYALEKFLKVCWEKDRVTGEANYSVDQDPSWSGQQSMFADENAIKRVDLFERDLQEFISKAMPDNKQMYKFVLEKGFSPAKARESLRRLQDNKWLEAVPVGGRAKPRKGDFYLGHDVEAKIQFTKVAGV